MVPHMVTIAKLHLQLTSHSGLRPVVGGIIGPLVLKLLVGFRLFRDQALYRSRLFLFRLGQIAFNRETPISTAARMEHALRLILETLHLDANASSTTTSSSSSSSSSQQGYPEIEHEVLHSLSMIAL